MTSSHKAIKTARGFTLIELMVVMLLISIILAVAIPRFDSGAFQDPVKKFSRWMINTVRTLRSSAIQKQKIQGLMVDLSNNRLWLVNDEMSEEELASASEKAMNLPSAIRLVDLEFPRQEIVTSGVIEVKFYPAGYSDHVLIHLENDNGERFTYLVEPLLPKVKYFDEWISF